MRNSLFIIGSLIILLVACAKKDKPSVETNDMVNDTPSAAEDSVIELYADLSATPTAIEGVWESDCKAFGSNSSFFKNRRVFHLNGMFREIALYNDVNCEAKSSQNTERFFGTITNIESIELSNGQENIQVYKVSTSLMRAPTVGFSIPLGNLTLDDLQFHSKTIEAIGLLENRMYIAENFNSHSNELLNNSNGYLKNGTIDISEKTEEQINQLAVALFNPE